MNKALLSCPTSSIRTEKPGQDILEAQKTFPIQINEQRIPVAHFLHYDYSVHIFSFFHNVFLDSLTIFHALYNSIYTLLNFFEGNLCALSNLFTYGDQISMESLQK